MDMDHLQQILPQHGRRTNHIYLAKEGDVFPKAKETATSSHRTTVINDDYQLYDVLTKIRQASKLKNPGSGKKIVDNILRSTQINLALVKIDLTKWINENPIDVQNPVQSDYVILREDSLSENNLSEFLSIFCSTAPMTQPQLVILPNARESSIEHRLRFSSSRITFSWLGHDRDLDIDIPRLAPSTIDEFAGLFDRRCFDAVARSDMGQLQEFSAKRTSVSSLAARLARLRARILTAERADVEPEVDELLFDMDRATEVCVAVEAQPYLLLRSLALLQKTYCSENPRFLNEALAISSTLRHDLGTAMCLRYANFLDVHPSLESHMLERAEEIFRRNECPDLEFYCVNNRLLSRLSVEGDHTAGFEDLMVQIDTKTPMLHRRGDIQYNVGVEHLLSNRLRSARNVFCSIDLSNARPLVVACAMLGQMACGWLEEGKVENSSGRGLIHFVKENVASSNRWHISNILLNALTIFQRQAADFEILLEESKPYIDLRSNLDVRDTLNENRTMATALGLDNFVNTARMEGRFGNFFRETGMTIPYFYIWS